MSMIVNPFSRASRAGDTWFCAGAASSYPDIDESSRIAQHRPCNGKRVPGCRVFHVPRDDSSKAIEVAIDDWKDPAAGDSKDQVMVFKYMGKFVAINHARGLHWVVSTTPDDELGMPALILPSVKWHTVRHRGLWRCAECWNYLSPA